MLLGCESEPFQGKLSETSMSPSRPSMTRQPGTCDTRAMKRNRKGLFEFIHRGYILLVGDVPHSL